MQSFDHLITTRPHEVRQVLISDLHLSPEEPALVQAFLALLDDCLFVLIRRGATKSLAYPTYH